MLFLVQNWEPALWFKPGSLGGKYDKFLHVCSPDVNFCSRFYGAMIPSLLNAFSLQGFLILNTIVGAQTLAAVSDSLDDTLGIVIIAVISLAVSFCGYKVIHMYIYAALKFSGTSLMSWAGTKASRGSQT